MQTVVLSRKEIFRLLAGETIRLAGETISVAQNRSPIGRIAGPKPKPGTCRICGCTDAKACAGTCWWVDKAHTLCSQCEFPRRYLTVGPGF